MVNNSSICNVCYFDNLPLTPNNFGLVTLPAHASTTLLCNSSTQVLCENADYFMIFTLVHMLVWVLYLKDLYTQYFVHADGYQNKKMVSTWSPMIYICFFTDPWGHYLYLNWIWHTSWFKWKLWHWKEQNINVTESSVHWKEQNINVTKSSDTGRNKT